MQIPLMFVCGVSFIVDVCLNALNSYCCYDDFSNGEKGRERRFVLLTNLQSSLFQKYFLE